MMDRKKITWIFSIGLLGLLGVASCSPRLRPRAASKEEEKPDTLTLPRIDTLKPPPGDYTPIKLMYGVPPARFEVMEDPGIEE